MKTPNIIIYTVYYARWDETFTDSVWDSREKAEKRIVEVSGDYPSRYYHIREDVVR